MVFIGGFQVQQVCEVVVNKAPTDHSWKNKKVSHAHLSYVCQ